MCDEFGDHCVHTGDPCQDDLVFCNGLESCDENTDQCVHSGSPCPDDGNFCNGSELCNEGSDSCGSSGSPCTADGLFCNGTEYCDPVAQECLHTGTPCPDDGLVCNGSEMCAEEKKDCSHSGTPCEDDGSFCSGLEFCDETNDTCNSAGNPCVDDGLFCNGVESCGFAPGPGEVCQHSGDPCLHSERCSEVEGVCKAELLVNPDTVGLQEHPDVAVLSDGRIVVVWQSNNTNENDYDIRGAIYDKDGFLDTDVVTLNASTVADQVHPALAVSPYKSGRVYVAWDSLDLEVTNPYPLWGYYPSYFAVFGASGFAPTVPETLVWMYGSVPAQSDLQVPIQQSSRPDIAALKGGGFTFAWTPGYPTLGHRQLWYNTCDKNGAKAASVAAPNLLFSQSSSTIDTASPGAVAASPDGTFIAAEVIYPGGVMARRINANGSLENMIYISDNWGEYQRPAVGAGAGGKAVVVWEEWKPEEGVEEEVYVQRLTGNGKTGSPILVNKTPLGRQTDPAVIMNGDSTQFIIVWTSVGQDGHGKGVYGRRFDFATGNPVNDEFRVNETTLGNQHEAAVALAPDGSFVVVWTSSTWEERDIYMRIFP